MVVLGVSVCRFSGNICGNTPTSPTMKGNYKKRISMYRKQGDRKHRRQVSLAAQWRKRYKHNIDVWHTETAATAPRDIEREAMDDANLMVIVHNSTDRRDKAPKYVRRKHKHAYSEHLGAAGSREHSFDETKMGKRRAPASNKEQKSLNNPRYW